MFLQDLESRGLSETIGDASAFARWIIENSSGDTSSGVNVTEQAALALPVVYACINVLSQTLAHTPLELLKDGAKGPTKATRHRLYEIIKTTPSEEQTAYTWRETVEGHRNGWGNGYSEIVRDGPFAVGFEIRYPDRTEPKRHASGALVYTTQDDDGLQRVVPSADMLHFAGLGFDGLKGYSPIHQAREAVGLGMAIHQFGASFFGKGASPKGVIESEVAPNALVEFASAFREQFGGLDRAHGTPVLPKGLTYKPTQINPDDAQTLETLKYNRTEICGLYRVPPQFVMDLERSTFTNAGEMDLHFVKHTMIPIFTNWENELNRKLLTAKERRLGYYFKFNVNGLLRGSTAERFSSYHIALQDGWMSRNEVRELEDREQVEGLDEFLTPNNMVNSTDSVQDEPDDDEPEEIRSNIAPLVRSIAERMASNERKRVQSKSAEKIDAFYRDYPNFIARIAMPVAEGLSASLNCQPEEFVINFADRHIEKQLRQTGTSLDDLVIDESAIEATFYEVLDNERT